MTDDATVVLSASQVDTYRLCKRKWAWGYLAGVKGPQHPSAKLGTEVDDEQLQPWLRDGRPFDFSKRLSAEIAESMRPLLPLPLGQLLGTPEQPYEIQHYFRIPSPGASQNPSAKGLFYQGYMDIFAAHDSRVFPGLGDELAKIEGYDGTPVPGVGDTKTTKDFKWAKTPTTLATDVQAMTYAVVAMFKTRARVVDLVWPYGRTTGARKSKRVHLRVHADHVVPQFRAIDATGQEMAEHVRELPFRLPKGETYEGLIPLVRDIFERKVMSFEPVPEACTAFGGCPHVLRCNLSQDALGESMTAQEAMRSGVTFELGSGDQTNMSEKTMSFIEQAKAKKAAQQAGGVTSTPQPAAVSPAAAPSSPPAPAAADVPTEAGERPAWLDSKEPFKGHVLGVNPPESKLPPAPAVGVAAPVAPPEPTATEPATPAAKGRARKAKADDAPGASAAAALTVVETETVRITWGPETRQRAQYEPVVIGPFEIVSSVRAGETYEEAFARVNTSLAKMAEAERERKLTSAKGAK